MNMPAERLRRGLVSLPPVAPSPDLWLRLDEARQRRIRRMKGSVGAGFALLLCAVMLPVLGDRSSGSAAPAPVAATAAPSEPLDAPPRQLDQATLEQIRALDRALQTAYDHGASDSEVEPMWKAREALLETHASTSNAAVARGSNRS